MVQLTNGQHTCKLVFKRKADILNIHREYQFVFSVLDELYVSHHAWCNRCCSKSALYKRHGSLLTFWRYTNRIIIIIIIIMKLIRRWDSERELSLRRHCTRTTKNRLLYKFRHRSVRLCVGTQAYQIHWNNAMYGQYAIQGHSRSPIYTTSY